MKNIVIDSAGMLKASGYSDFTAQLQPGDVQLSMPDHFNLEPGKWVTPDGGTTWTLAPEPPPPPDGRGFEGALKTLFGDPTVINGLLVKYPLFLWSLRDQNWAYVSAMLQAAKSAGDMTQAQYDAIVEAAQAHHVPLGG